MIEATPPPQQAFLQAQLGQAEEVLFEQQKEQCLWEGSLQLHAGATSAGSWVQVRHRGVKGKAVWGKIE